jgi:adenine-specific DNA glycosylase
MELERIVPDVYRLHAHHWLILHGRYVCVARKPRCPVCTVRALCRFDAKTEEPAPPDGTATGRGARTRPVDFALDRPARPAAPRSPKAKGQQRRGDRTKRG